MHISFYNYQKHHLHKCDVTDPCRSSRLVAAQSRCTSCGSLWPIRCHLRAVRDKRLPAASTFVTDMFSNWKTAECNTEDVIYHEHWRFPLCVNSKQKETQLKCLHLNDRAKQIGKWAAERGVWREGGKETVKERERKQDGADLAFLPWSVKGGCVVPCGLPD